MMFVKPPMTNFNMAVRVDCAFYACSPLPPHKSSSPLIVSGKEPDFGQKSLLETNIQNKAHFSFH